MLLRVNRILEKTEVAGPGYRFTVWVQGCGRKCAGCMASETWSPVGGSLLSTDDIIQKVLATHGIDGITFLGGEPFEQAEALFLIGKELRRHGFSVVTFTGYLLEELLRSENAGFNNLLSVTDLLIDGDFQENKKSLIRPWVGSSNQRYIFLTDRFSENDINQVRNKLEVRIFPDGRAVVTGMGDFHQIIKGASKNYSFQRCPYL